MSFGTCLASALSSSAVGDAPFGEAGADKAGEFASAKRTSATASRFIATPSHRLRMSAMGGKRTLAAYLVARVDGAQLVAHFH